MSTSFSSPFHRYSRQIRLDEIGSKGQERLSKSSVTILGCGALGSVLASLCARSGIGKIRLVDRDVVEIHNLQRQILYDEMDVEEGLPKVIAAKKKLEQINSSIQIDSFVADVTAENILSFLEDTDLVLDGSDNFTLRFLINDACHQQKIPWVYGGVISTYGHIMPILPDSPCLQCYIPDPPSPGESDTCEVVGVLGSTVQIISSLSFNQGLKILLGKKINLGLMILESWNPSLRILEVPLNLECPCCQKEEYHYLNQPLNSLGSTSVMCGNNAVQIYSKPIQIAPLAKKLESLGEVKANSYLLKFTLEDKSITLFENGRVIVTGTSNPREARIFFAQYIGM